jgi:hypothetical protein
MLFPMAGIDLSTAQSKLDLWLAAEGQLMAGQSVSLDGRQVTFADLRDVRAQIDYWEAKVKRLTAQSGGVSLQRAIFRG